MKGSLLDMRIAGTLCFQAKELKKSYLRFLCTEKLLRSKLVGGVKEQKLVSGKRLLLQEDTCAHRIAPLAHLVCFSSRHP